MTQARLVIALLLVLIGRCAGAQTEGPSGNSHQQLNQILQRPIYKVWELRQDSRLPNADLDSPFKAIGDWADGFFGAIRDFFKGLFPSSPNVRSLPRGNFDALPTVLKWFAVLVVVLAIIFYIVVLLKMTRGGSRTGTARILSREQVRDALHSGHALALGTTQWMDEARRLASEQNFRAVYRALYLGLLSGLHSAGKIDHNRNRTNWVYVQHYRGPDEERETFSELTDLFDRVWYGDKSAGGRDLDHLHQIIVTLTSPGGRA